MGAKVIQIAENFWNIRGSFKIAGFIDIGTQASLVKLSKGKYAFLDSYTLGGSVLKKVNDLTRDGKDVVAVLNLHPFHTIHVKWMHEQFPNAAHYGTARHLERFPELKWQASRTEDARTHAKFAEDLEFSVPRGVDFISDDENVHFSSVLVFHPSSKTIHVDDTLMYIRLPMLMRFFGLPDSLSFHPTLAKVLEKRDGAVQEFRDWYLAMTENWSSTENFCAAHTATLRSGKNDAPVHERMLKALEKVESTLKSHERKYGQ